MTDVALSVVIPAYNETARLEPTLRRVIEFLDDTEPRSEIVVADDGSTDDTVAIAERVAAEWPRLRVVELGHNQGKGAAVRAGMLAARGDLILFSDADLATPIEELAVLRAAIDRGADIAIASRAVEGADIRVRQHVLRESIGRAFNLLVRALGAGPFKDTQCGFKLFTRAAAHDLFGRATVDGFAFDVEILILARGRYEIEEVPVVWRHVEESKVSRLSGARAFADLVALRLRMARRR